MKYVVIVNGSPNSGKTSFEKLCKEYININEYAYCDMISSINPIKEIYRKLGWNGEKTDKARADLSLLKQMWIDICDGPTKYIIEHIMSNKYENNDRCIFIDIREYDEIAKLIDILNVLKILDITYRIVYIERPEYAGMEYGNKSDDMVSNNMRIYTDIIINDGSFDDLRKKAKIFVDNLIGRD